ARPLLTDLPAGAHHGGPALRPGPGALRRHHHVLTGQPGPDRALPRPVRRGPGDPARGRPRGVHRQVPRDRRVVRAVCRALPDREPVPAGARRRPTLSTAGPSPGYRLWGTVPIRCVTAYCAGIVGAKTARRACTV